MTTFAVDQQKTVNYLMLVFGGTFLVTSSNKCNSDASLMSMSKAPKDKNYVIFFFVVLPVLVLSVEGTLVNMSDVEQHSKLCENSELLGDKVKMIKSALKRPVGINIGLFYIFCSCLPDSKKIVPCSGFAITCEK